jgi:integrase
MATFTQTKAGTIKAELRQKRKGQKPIRITRTFDTLKEAKSWAAAAQAEIKQVRENGSILPTGITLGEALRIWWSDMQAYVDDDSRRGEDFRPRLAKRMHKIKSPHKFWLNHELASKPFRDIGMADLTRFIDEQREDDYSESTIKNKLYILSALWDHAAAATLEDGPTGWKWEIKNPTVAAVKSRRMGISKKRKRRLLGWEHDAILEVLSKLREGQLAAQASGSKEPIKVEIPGRPPLLVPPHKTLLYIPAAFLAAIESAMRREKMFEIEWSWINWNTNGTTDIVIPPQARGPENKEVPTRLAVSPDLRRILLTLNGTDQHGRPLTRTGDALNEKVFGPLLADRAYRLLVTAADALGIKDLHWHDLRHEACSRLADLGWTTIQIQQVSGHKTLQSLERYTHASTAGVHALFAATEARKQAAIAALEGLPEQPPPPVAATPPAPPPPPLRLVA